MRHAIQITKIEDVPNQAKTHYTHLSINNNSKKHR